MSVLLALSVGGLVVALLAVLVGGLRRRTVAPEDELPNLLLERFGADAILELAGVQFVVLGPQAPVAPGGASMVLIEAQNGWSTPRTLTVGLVPELRLARSRSRFAVPAPTGIELPAGAYARILLPIHAPVDAPGTHPILVLPGVTGKGGRRLRRWQARPYMLTIPPTASGLRAAFGSLAAAGSGLRVRTMVAGVPAAVAGPPSASATLVWAPTGDGAGPALGAGA